MASCRPEDIQCFEIGSRKSPAWVGSRRDLGDDLPPLELHAQRGIIHIEARGEQVLIRGTTRTGLVVLPSGRRLVLRTKVPSLTLLEWLAFLGDFPRLTSWLPEAGVSLGQSWHKCLGRMFLYALEDVTRHHLKKDYVAVATAASEIRGRILSTALARELHRLPRVPQIQRRRTIDTPFNIILARALDRSALLLADGDPDDIRRLSLLRDQWASIRRNIDDPAATVHSSMGQSPGLSRGVAAGKADPDRSDA